MIIKYDPNKIENIPLFFNEQIDKHQDEKFIMFIFNDIFEKINNKDDFFSKYKNLLEKFNLPYAFYPYYIHFNKVLKRYISFPNPRMRIKINNKNGFDVVNQTAYGMVILNMEKLKTINFKFNESYEKCFYIQQLIEECYKNNLYFSSSWYIDVFESYNLVNDSFKEGYKIDIKNFTEEKTKFFSSYKQEKEDLNKFLEKLNLYCKEIKEKEDIENIK